MIGSRRLSMREHVALMAEMGNVYRILVGKFKRVRPL
jgi:hypothetical protein